MLCALTVFIQSCDLTNSRTADHNQHKAIVAHVLYTFFQINGRASAIFRYCHLILSKLKLLLVPQVGLEPTHISTPGPKPGASTNFATGATLSFSSNYTITYTTCKLFWQFSFEG